MKAQTWSQCKCGALMCPAEPPLLQKDWLPAEGSAGMVTSYPKALTALSCQTTQIFIFSLLLVGIAVLGSVCNPNSFYLVVAKGS